MAHPLLRFFRCNHALIVFPALHFKIIALCSFFKIFSKGYICNWGSAKCETLPPMRWSSHCRKYTIPTDIRASYLTLFGKPFFICVKKKRNIMQRNVFIPSRQQLERCLQQIKSFIIWEKQTTTTVAIIESTLGKNHTIWKQLIGASFLNFHFVYFSKITL